MQVEHGTLEDQLLLSQPGAVHRTSSSSCCEYEFLHQPTAPPKRPRRPSCWMPQSSSCRVAFGVQTSTLVPQSSVVRWNNVEWSAGQEKDRRGITGVIHLGIPPRRMARGSWSTRRIPLSEMEHILDIRSMLGCFWV